MEFGPGLNILTGETGAGKSILLGSMQLILGGRSRQRYDTCRRIVRTCGAAVSGRESEVQKKHLRELGIETGRRTGTSNP